MNKHSRQIVLASLLASLATFASAQVLSGAPKGATPVTLPAVTPPPPPPTVNTGAAAQGATSAATSVRAPMGSTAAAGSGVDPTVSASSEKVTAAASPHAAASGDVKGVTFAPGLTSEAAISANRAEIVSRIQQTAFAQREALTAELQGRVDASSAALPTLQARANRAGEKALSEFAKVLVDVRAREKALRTSLREAAAVTREESWGRVQSTLAKDYDAYVEAVVRAETAVGAEAGTR